MIVNYKASKVKYVFAVHYKAGGTRQEEEAVKQVSDPRAAPAAFGI